MKGERGFTIVEILVAIMILTVGMLGLVTTAGLVTRMIGQGQRFTQASSLANERIEILKSRRCPTTGSGSETRGRFTISWRVVDVAGGKGKGITVAVVSPTTRGTRTDNFETVQFCP